MKPFHLMLSEGLIVDNFAGGGGASTGIEAAIGRSVDVAINHDPEAIAMHKANHPNTRHYCQDVWEVCPIEATRGRPVALAWFSPDCKHFSKAKGGKPREKKIRDLAWVVHRWVEALKPTDQHPLVIMLENVEEFRTWGPLLDDGKPCPDRKGETFLEWVEQLRSHGYAVQWKELKACDYGAPTSRKRLFLIARRDGQPIIWPEPSHGPLRAQPYQTAADIIDWSLPCPSIFERKRALQPTTLRRIALGVKRFVIDAPRPFIVPVTHTKGGNAVSSIDDPLRTITTAKGGEFALAVPTLIQTGYGERAGQQPRVPGLHKPLGTVVAGGGKHALVCALIAQHNGGPRNLNISGRGADEPLSTITGRGTQQALVTSNLIKLRKGCVGQPTSQPIGTLTGKTHFAEVRALLIKYYGNEQGGHGLDGPIGTVTTKDRFGLVTCPIEPETWGIADIGMRMLSEGELYAAQSFPPEYQKRPIINGKPMTKTSSVAKCGNSVPPIMAKTLVRANLPSLCPDERIAA